MSITKLCDTYLDVPLISINLDHLELTPESYNLSKSEFGYLGNGDRYVRGVSQTYSHLVQANCLEKPAWIRSAFFHL